MFDLNIRSIWASRTQDEANPLLHVYFNCGCWAEFYRWPDSNEYSPVALSRREPGYPASGPGTGPDCRAHILASVLGDECWQVA